MPGVYGMKSVQWLTEIEVVDYPGHGDTIRGLDYTVQGLAFAGTRGIQKVEISTDEGDSWQLAVLDAPLSHCAWVFWRYDWKIPSPGSYSLLVRATDGTGRLQSDFEQEPAPDGAEGLHEVGVSVKAS